MKANHTVCRFACLLICAAAALGTSLVASAAAADDSGQQVVVVKTRDLDLSARAGAQTLYVRLREAANSACGLADSSDALLRAAWLKCRSATLAQAVHSVNVPLLSKIYEERHASEQSGDDLLVRNADVSSK